MSSSQAKDSSFWGGRMPSEMESMAKNLKDVDQEMFRKIIKAMVSSLEGKDCRALMKSIAVSSTIPQERLSHIIAGMYRVLSEAIRIPSSSLKQDVNIRPSLQEWRKGSGAYLHGYQRRFISFGYQPCPTSLLSPHYTCCGSPRRVENQTLSCVGS